MSQHPRGPAPLSLPVDRPLPGDVHAAVRARLVDTVERGGARARRPSPSRRPVSRRWIVPLASALAVAALGAAVAILPSANPWSGGPVTPGHGPGPIPSPTAAFGRRPVAGPPVVNRAMTAAEQRKAVQDCVRGLLTGDDPATFRAEASRMVKSWVGEKPVVLVIDRVGHEYYCGTDGAQVVAGPDPKPQGPSAQPSAAHPAVLIGSFGITMATRAGGTRVNDATAESLLRVDSRVAGVQARIGTAADPGTWTEGVIVGGYAFTLAERGGPFTNPSGNPKDVRYEIRTYDSLGNPLPTP